jgi:succinate-semialdehyde dehydrogenase / glutarate-semialdehyde dehydrogenase
MELGVSDTFIVLEDADLPRAIALGAGSRLYNAGQICMCAKRFIVHEKVADAFLEGFVQKFKQARIGDPMDPQTTLDPLSSIAARDNLAQQVDNAVKHGAKVLVGGRALPRPGAFCGPPSSRT